MAQFESTHPAGLSVPVEQVARLIRSLDRRQKARLLQLVPELGTIQPEEADIPAQQEALLTYFEHKLDIVPERRPMHDDDPFLGGLTVAEFFALPEDERTHVWDQAHAEAEHELDNYEQAVQPDALPAR